MDYNRNIFEKVNDQMLKNGYGECTRFFFSTKETNDWNDNICNEIASKLQMKITNRHK